MIEHHQAGVSVAHIFKILDLKKVIFKLIDKYDNDGLSKLSVAQVSRPLKLRHSIIISILGSINLIDLDHHRRELSE